MFLVIKYLCYSLKHILQLMNLKLFFLYYIIMELRKLLFSISNQMFKIYFSLILNHLSRLQRTYVLRNVKTLYCRYIGNIINKLITILMYE